MSHDKTTTESASKPKSKPTGAAKSASAPRASSSARRSVAARAKRPYDQGYRCIQRVWPD